MQSIRKLQPVAAVVILAAMACAMFFPALFKGEILAPLDITRTMLGPWKKNSNGEKPHNHATVDAVTQYLPYRMFAEKSLKEDGYIGWNPYEMGGCSLAGNTMALPGSWAMQLHRFLQFKDAWNLSLLAEFLTAGSGMLIFLRHRKLPWIACLLGAAAYMANNQFVIWIYHRWALGSFCWLPWILWSAADGFNWKSPAARQLMLPVFLTLAILGGSLQHMAFVVLACGCLFCGKFSGFQKPFGEWRPALSWTFVFVAATAMAAFSVFPQIDAYLTNISIGHTRGGIGYEQGISQPFKQALLIPAQIWPWLIGSPGTIDGFRLFDCVIMDVAYLGTIPMVLAIWGVFRKKMPAQAKWLILVGLLIPLTPLVGPLYHRVQLLFLLGGSWMAAEMLADLKSNPSRHLKRAMVAVVSMIGVAMLVITFLPKETSDNIDRMVVTKAIKLSENSVFGEDKKWIEKCAKDWVAAYSLSNPQSLWVYGLLVMGTAGLVLSDRKKPALHQTGGILIVLVTSLELLTFFHSWTTFSDPRTLNPGNPAIDTVRRLAGSHRVLQQSPETSFTNTFAAPNLLSSYYIPSVDAYESIQYRSTLTTLDQVETETRLSLAGVGVSVAPAKSNPAKGTESWKIEETVNGYDIRTNPELPPPFAAGHGLPPSDAKDIIGALKSSTSVSPSLHTMNRITLLPPEGCNWIRIAQNWHQGWQWRTAGHDWTPVRKGSDFACWIDLPQGSAEEIEVRFSPRPGWTTLLSVLATISWFFIILANIAGRFVPAFLPGCRMLHLSSSHPLNPEDGSTVLYGDGSRLESERLTSRSSPANPAQSSKHLSLMDKLIMAVICAVAVQGLNVLAFSRVGALPWCWTGSLLVFLGFVFTAIYFWRKSEPTAYVEFYAAWKSPWPWLLVVAMVLQIAIYAPTMHDTLSYRIPRMFLALQEGSITNFQTPDFRMNSMPWGWEFMALPFASLNVVSLSRFTNMFFWAFAYQMFFSWAFAFTPSTRRARWVALAMASSIGYILQSNSTGNDLYASILLMAGVWFIRRHKEVPGPLPVMMSLLALVLATNVKPQFLVLGLFWLAWWIFGPGSPWKRVSWWIWLAAFPLYFLISPLALLFENLQTQGSLTGAHSMGGVEQQPAPLFMMVAGTVQFLVCQLQLPIFPGADRFSTFIFNNPVFASLHQLVPKFAPTLQIVPLVDGAGFGLVHFLLILLGSISALRAGARSERFWVLAGLAGFMIAASQIVPATISRSFMGFFSLILPVAVIGMVRMTNRIPIIAACITAYWVGFSAIMLNPSSPLWPHQYVESVARKQGADKIARMLEKYRLYQLRSKTGSGLLDDIPKGAKVGVLLRQITPSSALWSPDWRSHKIDFIHHTSPLSFADGSYNWLIVGDKSKEQFPEQYKAYSSLPGWKKVLEKTYLPNISQGNETWTLYHKTREMTANP